MIELDKCLVCGQPIFAIHCFAPDKEYRHLYESDEMWYGLCKRCNDDLPQLGDEICDLLEKE